MSRSVIEFRPTEDDRRALATITRTGLTTTEAIRRGLHLVAHEQWLGQTRVDVAKMRAENVNDAPEAW